MGSVVVLADPDRCSYCGGDGEIEITPEFALPCKDCRGHGTVCNLCRHPPGVCECGGVINECEVCGRPEVACRCGMN